MEEGSWQVGGKSGTVYGSFKKYVFIGDFVISFCMVSITRISRYFIGDYISGFWAPLPSLSSISTTYPLMPGI